VLESGSAVGLGDDAQHANAILETWYGGEFGGQAVADILKGTINPSGRLPITFYSSVSQLPDFTDYSMKGRTYRYFSGTPAYPFGFGLSYTKFSYSKLHIASELLQAGVDQHVSVSVKNAGSRAGDEVVELYLSIVGAKEAPIRSLKGFTRIYLNAGQETTVRFRLSPRDLALAGEDGTFRITPATYNLWVGGGQPHTKASGMSASFQMRGDQEFPR
jgi:beta-glucosidase